MPAVSVPRLDPHDYSCPCDTYLFENGATRFASAQNARPIRSQRCQIAIQLPSRDLGAVLVPLEALCIKIATKSVFA